MPVLLAECLQADFEGGADGMVLVHGSSAACLQTLSKSEEVVFATSANFIAADEACIEFDNPTG
jgi:hypothetical protein